MNPLNKNYNDGCAQVGAACVIWDGPDIPCLHICHGDSVQKIVYELGKQHCELAASLDMTSLNLSCLVESCLGCPNPSYTIKSVLQLLINKVCSLEDLIGTGGSTSGGTLTLPTLNLPQCLQYTQNGSLVVSLEMDDYLTLLANKYCETKTLVAEHELRLDTAETDINLLQQQITQIAGIPAVNASCIGLNSATDIDVAMDELITRFCALQTTLGSNANLAAVLTKQCANLASSSQLGGTGNMSAISGWVGSPATIADTMTNLWLTICDLRAAVTNLNTITAPSCNNFVLDYNWSFNSNRTVVTFNLYGMTQIPTGFTPCAGSPATVVISDGITSYTYTFDVSTEAANSSGFNINLSTYGIDGTRTITATMTVCVSKSGLVCTKAKAKSSVPTCITSAVVNVTSPATSSSTTITTSWSAPVNVPLNPSNYVLNVYKQNGGNWDFVTAYIVPFGTNSYNITFPTAASTYKVDFIAQYSCGYSAAVSKTTVIS